MDSQVSRWERADLPGNLTNCNRGDGAVLKGDADRKKKSRDHQKEINVEAVLRDGAKRQKKSRDHQKKIDAEAVLRDGAKRVQKHVNWRKEIDNDGSN